MLDIISMIIILFFLMGLPMILIIIGGSKSKSEQERAYGEIALHNLTKSANEINMRNFKKCIDPLQTLYAKDGVEGMAEYLINKYEK